MKALLVSSNQMGEDPSESLLAIAGRHSIKGGVEFRKLEYSTWNSGSNSGQFNFNQQPTANVGTQKQGIGFASFLLGIPTAPR